MASECAVWVAKYVLCVFNFLFFVLGTMVLGIGIWLAVDKSSLIALLKMVESEHINKFTQPQVIEQLAYVLIVIGAVMFFMSFLGYCGAIQESRGLLITYGVLMVLLLLAEVVTGGLAVFFKDKSHAETKAFLQSTITKYYNGAADSDAITLMWNQMMSSFGCCGVDGYHDFEGSAAWTAHRGNRTLPAACCVLQDVAALVPLHEDCVTHPTEDNSYFTKGCYDVFSDWIISHRQLILCVLLSIGFVHLIATFLAFCLWSSFTKYHGMRL